nr:MAG TPA: hypothetical protein [Caudoviricetes sp.]
MSFWQNQYDFSHNLASVIFLLYEPPFTDSTRFELIFLTNKGSH